MDHLQKHCHPCCPHIYAIILHVTPALEELVPLSPHPGHLRPTLLPSPPSFQFHACSLFPPTNHHYRNLPSHRLTHTTFQ
ncbi:hypothetical protein FKM82_019220 [Ascaphus truei]